MLLPNLSYEQELWGKDFLVIGVDEVGRGAFAGPIFAAGVVFPQANNNKRTAKLLSYGINDSKKLKPTQRQMLDKVIQKESLAIYISQIDVAEINRIGIGRANQKAMRQVVKRLCQMSHVKGQMSKTFVLVDGFRIKNLSGFAKNQKAIIHGDSISLSIAAASIVAKVARDNYMRKLAKVHPQYNWGQNKGYGTLFHRTVLSELGPTPFHRTDFVEGFI